MINLLKKFVLALVIVLGVLNFTCFAESDFVIKPKGEFYEYSENPTKVAEIIVGGITYAGCYLLGL